MFGHPTLARSFHATAQPDVPEMLVNLCLIPPIRRADATDHISPTVPLLEEFDEGTTAAKSKLGPGRVMFLFVKNRETLERFAN